jgi:hypothetical protein
MAPTYLIYTNHTEQAKATLWLEMGEVYSVPNPDEMVSINGTPYLVIAIKWDVYTERHPLAFGDRYPQQCATVLVTEMQ